MCAILGVLVLLFITACPCNACLVWVILRTNHLRTITNIFIVSLGVCDFMIGLLIIPFEMVHYGLDEVQMNGYFCVLHQCVQAFVPLVTVAHLLMVTIDRYVKIVHPLKYVIIASRSRVIFALILLWTIPFIVASLPMFGLNNIIVMNNTEYTDPDFEETGCDHMETLPCSFKTKIFGFVIVAVVIMVLVYIKLCSVSLRQARKIKALTIGANTCTQNNMMSRELRVILVLLVTIGYFCLSWSSLSVAVFYRCVKLEDPDSDWWTWSFIIAYANGSINPLVYGIGNRDIRRTFVRSCPCLRTKRTPNTKKAHVYMNDIPSCDA